MRFSETSVAQQPGLPSEETGREMRGYLDAGLPSLIQQEIILDGYLQPTGKQIDLIRQGVNISDLQILYSLSPGERFSGFKSHLRPITSYLMKLEI